jgi:cysteine synthase
MARKLHYKEGLMVGISSSVASLALVQIGQKQEIDGKSI